MFEEFGSRLCKRRKHALWTRTGSVSSFKNFVGCSIERSWRVRILCVEFDVVAAICRSCWDSVVGFSVVFSWHACAKTHRKRKRMGKNAVWNQFNFCTKLLLL